MTIVSDTSILNYLIRIGRIDILADIFGLVVIPTEIHEELSDPMAPGCENLGK